MCCSGLSCKLVIALGFSIFLFIAEGINYSQLAPFFPNEAEVNKGVSKFLVGVISSCFDFSTLVFSLLLPLCAKPQLNKFFFVWGAIIGAIANMGFGMLGEGQGGVWFVSMCFLSRILMGIGASMVWATGIPLLTSLAPSYAGRITSLAESAAGLGIAIGPPIGSAVFTLGGYKYPFLTSGGIELFVVLFAIFTLPEPRDEHQNNTSYDDAQVDDIIFNDSMDSDSFDVPMISPSQQGPQDEGLGTPSTIRACLEFLSVPGIWAFSVILPLFGIPFGLLDVSLSPYLLHKFDITGDTAGLYFLSAGATYAICTQFIGIATDKGFAAYTFFWLSNMLVVVTGLYYLPSQISLLENQYYIAAVLGLNGLAMSGTYVPLYLILQEIAMDGGYSDSLDHLKLVIGIWLNFVMAVGRILGSIVFGGVIYPIFGFHFTFATVFGCFAVGSLISNGFLILSGNYRRMYYNSRVFLEESLDRD